MLGLSLPQILSAPSCCYSACLLAVFWGMVQAFLLVFSWKFPAQIQVHLSASLECIVKINLSVNCGPKSLMKWSSEVKTTMKSAAALGFAQENL